MDFLKKLGTLLKGELMVDIFLNPMLIKKALFCLTNFLIVKCIFVLQKAKKKKIDKKTPGDLGVDRDSEC